MSDSDGDYPVSEIARGWLVKMRGENADALRAEFQEWLERAPEHREAYNSIQRRLDGAAVLKRSARFGTARAQQQTQRVARPWLPWGAVATIAGLLLIAYGALGATLPAPLTSGSAAANAAETFTTRRGEIRSFQLPDGSIAILDTASRLEVTISSDERRVRLTRGRARFTVSADRLPFTAQANDVTVQARNAEFDLAVAAPGTGSITLWRGNAQITGPATDANSTSTPIHLQSAGAFAYHVDEKTLRLESAPGQHARGWPSGWASYRKVALGRLVSEANHYAERPIVLDTPALAKIDVTGRFKISDTRVFARQIAVLLDLSMQEESDRLHLRER